MDGEPKEIYTVEIPFDTTMFEWARSEKGKSIVFPELLIGCEELIYGNVDTIHCMTVISYETGRPEEHEFVVREYTIENTLKKIMDWSIENEYYENECVRIRELQKILKSRKTKELKEIEQSASKI